MKLQGLIKTISKNKLLLAGIITLAAIGGFFGYKAVFAAKSATSYVTGMAERGTITSYVSSSGQIEAVEQLDIRSKVSGDVTAIYVSKGQEVKKGKLLLVIDPTDALKTARDMETSLDIAKLDLKKVMDPTDALTLLQSENSLASAKNSEQDTKDVLEKSYEDGLSALDDIFLKLPTLISDLDDILFDNDFKTSQWNIDWYADSVKNYDNSVWQYRNLAYNSYQTARKKYDANFIAYKALNNYSDSAVIEDAILDSYNTIKSITQALRDMKNLADFVDDMISKYNLSKPSVISVHQTNLNAYLTSANKYLSSVWSASSAIKNKKDSVDQYAKTIAEKELSLQKLKNGADESTIKSKQLSVEQKENNLLAAKQSLADHYIYAGFDGIVASLSVKKGDTLSSGSAIASLITKQKMAKISLTEADIAKVKENQPATLTFDAIEDMTLTGKIYEVDSIGTTTQGIVTYGIKIVLDSDDSRLKSGMTVNANIITDKKDDVIYVPNSAVSTKNGANTAQIMQNGSVKTVSVETGIFNDEYTEITSGINEGDEVVTSKATSGSSAAKTGQSTTRTGSRSGMGGFGGGFIAR